MWSIIGWIVVVYLLAALVVQVCWSFYYMKKQDKLIEKIIKCFERMTKD